MSSKIKTDYSNNRFFFGQLLHKRRENITFVIILFLHER